MAHYAELDENMIVQRVLVMGDEDEEIISAQLLEQFGTVWKRTSYNTLNGVHAFGGTPFRKNYAGIGYFYDEILDAFVPPQCHAEATLNETTAQWECANEIHQPPVSE